MKKTTRSIIIKAPCRHVRALALFRPWVSGGPEFHLQGAWAGPRPWGTRPSSGINTTGRSTWSIRYESWARPWPAPNNEIKATSARRGDRCFDQKGNCWRRTQPRCILRWLSTGAAVQMLTFIRLLAVISAISEICKGLNGIVTFHNPHRGAPRQAPTRSIIILIPCLDLFHQGADRMVSENKSAYEWENYFCTPPPRPPPSPGFITDSSIKIRRESH